MKSVTPSAARVRILVREREGLPVCGHLLTSGERCPNLPTFRVEVERVTRFYLCTRHANTYAGMMATYPTAFADHSLVPLV